MPLEYQLDVLQFSKRNDLDFPIHAQGEIEIVIMLRGNCLVTCGNVKVKIGPGDIFFAFPNQLHQYENSTDVEAYIMILPVQEFLPGYYNLLSKQVPLYPVLSAENWDPEDILPLVEKAYLDRNVESTLVMQGYFTVITGKLLEKLALKPRSSVSDGAMQRILEFLNQHYREPITRMDIGKKLGYHSSYISHLFSDSMHISLPEYLNSLRIEEACRILRETDIPISDFCSEIGFQSIRNFNRVFFQRLGMTPREYRNLKQEETALLI